MPVVASFVIARISTPGPNCSDSLPLDCRNIETRQRQSQPRALLYVTNIAVVLWTKRFAGLQAAEDARTPPELRISRLPVPLAGLMIPSRSMRSIRSAARL